MKWLKNIGEDGWSSTMESQSAYENEGGYISESGNWKIYRDGQFYERDWGSNFERRGNWGVYNVNHPPNEQFYGDFKTLSEAKKYVSNWIAVNPKDYSEGGGVGDEETWIVVVQGMAMESAKTKEEAEKLAKGYDHAIVRKLIEYSNGGSTYAGGGEIKYNIIDKATKNVIESYSDPIEAEENLRELNLATKQDWGKKDHYTIEIDSTYAEGGEIKETSAQFKKRSEKDSIRIYNEWKKVLDSDFGDKEYQRFEKLVKDTQIPSDSVQKIQDYTTTTPRGQHKLIDIYHYWGKDTYAEGGEIALHGGKIKKEGSLVIYEDSKGKDYIVDGSSQSAQEYVASLVNAYTKHFKAQRKRLEAIEETGIDSGNVYSNGGSTYAEDETEYSCDNESCRKYYYGEYNSGYCSDECKNSYAEGGKIKIMTNKNYEKVVNHWVYFMLNYSRNFIDAFPEMKSHLQSKFDGYYDKSGAYGVMTNFWSELSGDNRKALATWVKANYKGKPTPSVSDIEYEKIVNHWVYFTLNYPRNWMDAFTSMKSHLESKFKGYHDKYGGYGAMTVFWSNLDGDNRELLATWVKNNYKGTPLKDGGSIFPNDKIGQIDQLLSDSTDSKIRNRLIKVRGKLLHKIRLSDSDVKYLEDNGINTYSFKNGGSVKSKWFSGELSFLNW